jgi:hypothetical protein
VVVGTNDSVTMGLNSGLIFGGSITAILPLSIQMFMGFNSQLTLGIAQQAATMNVQNYGINIQHNVTNLSWDDNTVQVGESAKVELRGFVSSNSLLMLFT